MIYKKEQGVTSTMSEAKIRQNGNTYNLNTQLVNNNGTSKIVFSQIANTGNFVVYENINDIINPIGTTLRADIQKRPNTHFYYLSYYINGIKNTDTFKLHIYQQTPNVTFLFYGFLLLDSAETVVESQEFVVDCSESDEELFHDFTFSKADSNKKIKAYLSAYEKIPTTTSHGTISPYNSYELSINGNSKIYVSA